MQKVKRLLKPRGRSGGSEQYEGEEAELEAVESRERDSSPESLAGSSREVWEGGPIDMDFVHGASMDSSSVVSSDDVSFEEKPKKEKYYPGKMLRTKFRNACDKAVKIDELENSQVCIDNLCEYTAIISVTPPPRS